MRKLCQFVSLLVFLSCGQVYAEHVALDQCDLDFPIPGDAGKYITMLDSYCEVTQGEQTVTPGTVRVIHLGKLRDNCDSCASVNIKYSIDEKYTETVTWSIGGSFEGGTNIWILKLKAKIEGSYGVTNGHEVVFKEEQTVTIPACKWWKMKWDYSIEEGRIVKIVCTCRACGDFMICTEPNGGGDCEDRTTSGDSVTGTITGKVNAIVSSDSSTYKTGKCPAPTQ
jgi:hypothetical protein